MRSKPPKLPSLNFHFQRTNLSLRANMSTATQVLPLALFNFFCQNVKTNHFESPFLHRNCRLPLSLSLSFPTSCLLHVRAGDKIFAKNPKSKLTYITYYDSKLENPVVTVILDAALDMATALARFDQK